MYHHVYLFFLNVESKLRDIFMKGISTDTDTYVVHYVNRSSLFNDLIDLYEDTSILKQYPLHMSFVGELGVDLGGVSRDVITGFWLDAYVSMFDGSNLLIPSVSPHTNLSQLASIGKILSHGYMCTGFLPVQVALPTLVLMLLGPSLAIDSKLLKFSFFDYLNTVDREILKKAVNFIETTGDERFPPYLQQDLLTLFSAYNIRQIPSPKSLMETIIDTARYLFITKPMSAICAVHSGIPVCHREYWNSKSPGDIQMIYQALTATPCKVLLSLDVPLFNNEAQETTYGYLRQFIGNMSSEEIQMFLRFVTGSSVCSTEKIEVEFNVLSGLARRPIAHTCGNTLELSATYRSYPEFEKEFKAILLNEFSWIMDSM